MMATYFRANPRVMFEASTLDGASILRSFVTFAFPMARNSIATVAIVQFFFIWNDLLVAITFTNSSSLQTIQVGLLNFTGQYRIVVYEPPVPTHSINMIVILMVVVLLTISILF